MTQEPVRIQRSRQHKQESPNGLPIQYVGRPGKFGNPYHVIPTGDECYNVVFGSKGGIQLLVAWALSKEMATELAIEKYRDGLSLSSCDLIKKELKGKNLSCWCKIGEPCHASVLLEIANKD